MSSKWEYDCDRAMLKVPEVTICATGLELSKLHESSVPEIQLSADAYLAVKMSSIVVLKILASLNASSRDGL
jgi:hypothetical protein